MLYFRSLAPVVLVSLGLAACADDAGDRPTVQAPVVEAAENGDAAVTQHIDVVRQRIAANNAKDWNAWEALHTEGAVRTSPDLPAPLVGAKALRAGIQELVTTFPDYHLELVDAFGSGDRLVARIHTRATMTGPLHVGDTTLPPTGKSFEQDWIAVLRFENGRISSIDEFYDNYSTLLQLGLGGGQ